MFSFKKVKRKEGETDPTPEVIESAAEEIITSANEILEMYGIEGGVISLGLGLLPIAKKIKSKNGEVISEAYYLEFIEHEEYAVAVHYKHQKMQKK